MNRLLQLSFVPRNADLALLVLRLWFGFSLFLRHGWEKIATFSEMAARFPDPIGIGPVPSLVIAMISDSICSLLCVLGIATRPAAFLIFANTIVAFFLVHKATLLGQRNGEGAWVYAGAYLVLFLAGPGRFSIDGLMAGTKKEVKRDEVKSC
jgi:putative oxidoreductase